MYTAAIMTGILTTSSYRSCFTVSLHDIMSSECHAAYEVTPGGRRQKNPSRPSDANMRPWWRHQMETFAALLALFEGNSLVTGEFPSQSQWRGALMFSLLCAWTNGWANHRDAGDLRRHRVHCGITEMSVNYVIIGFDDRCHLFGAKPLFWTNTDSIVYLSQRNKLQWKVKKIKTRRIWGIW